ncbi:MAG: hypothetical protein ACYTFV_17105 [Planctomycetota bacterium]|jgi:hypothetical protein
MTPTASAPGTGSDLQVKRRRAGCGCVLLLVLALTGASFLAWKVLSKTWPDSAVIVGDKLPAFVPELLLDNGILEPEERILFLYSAAFSDYLDDGNLLTDQRVISYERVDGELRVYSAAFDEVRSVDPLYSQKELEDTRLSIETASGAFPLLLSTEDGLDQEFIRELKRRVAGER